MGDNENLLSISQKLLKKISNRNLSDNNSDSGSSISNMDSSPEITSPQLIEQAFQNDSRFRKYVQLVEKNLQSFDAVNEWADIISFLGRLLKSFQAYPQFPVIPRKQLVAKRLAQCLNPGFPAGVHQKTLEVYTYILKTIGPDQLTADLALWSTGLFPFVQYAATHVKPQLLRIFEVYYLPLKSKLRPAMRGFIIALLPALEEEGSEYFDKVVQLIENLSETVELPFFYSCMWLVMISNPTLRPPALNYLLRKLPRINDREAVALVLGGKENVSLMVRAFASTLNDHQLLVQRGMLEILVQNFILKNRMIPHEDLVILMKAALGIVLRKDMSLNRRLYAWLLGNENAAQAQVLYFNSYAEKAATQAVRNMLQQQQQQDSETELQRPYKILISLMDKWELGQPIVNNIFVDSLSSLKSIKSNQADVIKAANMWMDMVEPYLICMKLFELIDSSFPNSSKKTQNPLENLRLVEFILESFQFSDDEIKYVHFPFILAALTRKLQDSLKTANFIENLPLISQCITLIIHILEKLPESIFLNRTPPPVTEDKQERKQFQWGMNVLDYVREFYGFGQSVQQLLPQQVEMDEHEEEGGDLSINNSSHQQIQYQQSRPEYDPLRGQLLLKIVTEDLSGFLISFVNSYIVLPDNLLSGIDVGAQGKNLKNIEHHLERVFLGACTGMTLVSKYATEDFDLDSCEQLTQVLLKCCQQVKVFGVVDAGLSTLTLLVKQRCFVDASVLKHTSNIRDIVDKLWGFLSPSMQLLHMRTVELLWLLIDASVPHQIEAIISSYLINEQEENKWNNYEKFGILWELSENIPEASVVFSRPMFMMLDLLREGASPMERRAGDLWIRCHLKSYVRLLEPFITTLLDKHILRRPAQLTVDWQNQMLKNDEDKKKETQIDYYIYLRPFDTDIVTYLLSTLVTLVTFGGMSLLRSCKNHTISNESPITELARTAFDYDTSKPFTFLDLLIRIFIRFLETEPSDSLVQRIGREVRSIQLLATDLLYLIISKLDHVPMKIVQQIQTSALHKLLFCLDQKNLDLQQKLLHLLHACLVITCTSITNKEKGPGHQKRGSVDSISSVALTNQANDALILMQTSSELFVKCCIDAFSMSSNRTMLQHWMDFVLATLPYIRHGFRSIIVPLLMCLCHQINLRCDTIEIVIHEKPQTSSSCASAEREVIILLMGLEKMMLFCLTERMLTMNDDWTGQDLPMPRIPEHSALVGLAQIITHDEDDLKPRDIMMFHLPVVLQILANAWRAFRKPTWSDLAIESMGEAKQDAIMGSFLFAAEEAKDKLRNFFERLFKFSAVDFIEGLTEIFYMGNPTALEFDQSEAMEDVALQILSHTPSSSPQYVISVLLDSIRQRTPGTYQNKRRKILRHGKLTDTSILRFAEIYCDYIKSPDSLVSLWPIIHAFSKDYLSQANTYKMFVPSLMRFLTVSLEELSKSSGYEQDRRIRKDAQELYQRCIDYCILIAGKSFDQSLWMRGRSTLYDENTDDTASVHTVESTETDSLSMTRNVSNSNVSEMEKKASWKLREDLMINQINQYLANKVIPRLRQLVGDNDKINSLLNNLVYYVIGPALKSKVKSPVVLDQLYEMAAMPFTYKTWRKEIWEVFIDNRFFYMNSAASKKWRRIIETAFSVEKERMTELMARITTSPSTTFFSNKDQETLNRSLNLRRLSFVLFAGTMDQYVAQLPIIQEKIVELLKLDHSEMVHMEIYLCLRVILMRFSQKHFMNFWPVIITELMRLFNSYVYQDFQDRPEEAQIILAGCKFLDLLCILELDAFQIYQWIFIRDTVETLIKKHTEGPIPIMESIYDKITSKSTDAFDFTLSESSMQPSLGSLKRPMLTMHSITSIKQLSFFVEHVGLYVYQSSFTLSTPDLPFIESLLLSDLLDEESQIVDQ